MTVVVVVALVIALVVVVCLFFGGFFQGHGSYSAQSTAHRVGLPGGGYVDVREGEGRVVEEV